MAQQLIQVVCGWFTSQAPLVVIPFDWAIPHSQLFKSLFLRILSSLAWAGPNSGACEREDATQYILLFLNTYENHRKTETLSVCILYEVMWPLHIATVNPLKNLSIFFTLCSLCSILLWTLLKYVCQIHTWTRGLYTRQNCIPKSQGQWKCGRSEQGGVYKKWEHRIRVGGYQAVWNYYYIWNQGWGLVNVKDRIWWSPCQYSVQDSSGLVYWGLVKA